MPRCASWRSIAAARLLHVLDAFRLGQQDRIEPGPHHRIEIVQRAARCVAAFTRT